MSYLDGWQWLIKKGADTFTDWYTSPSKDETDYNLHQFAKNIPILGWYLSALDTSQETKDYLENRDLDWSDIRYNRAPFGMTYGSALAHTGTSALNLYRSATRKQSARKGGKKRPPKGPVPIGYAQKHYVDFRGGKVYGGQYHVNQNGRKSYPSTYRRYRGY